MELLDFLASQPKVEDTKRIVIMGNDGALTDAWIDITHTCSNVYTIADSRIKAEMAEKYAGKPDINADEVGLYWMDRIAAAMIVGWSFDTPLTEKNKLKMLEALPMLKSAIITNTETKYFLTQALPPSTNMQERTQGSTKSQKTPTAQRSTPSKTAKKST